MSVVVDLLDGGCGMELKKRKAEGQNVAYDLTLFSTAALRDTPDAILDLYRDWIKAGCTVITTASYAVTRFYLDKIGEGDRVGELAERSLKLAREAIEMECAVGKVKIAASIPPLGQSYNEVKKTEADMEAEYSVLVRALSGADVFLIETMGTLADARLACKMCQNEKPEVPIWVAFHPRRDGGRAVVSVDGASITEATHLAVEIGVEALLFNCATPHVVEMAIVEAARTLAESDSESGTVVPPRLGAYANFWEEVDARGWSIDKQETSMGAGDQKAGGFIVRKDLTDDMYAADVGRWIEAGATIVGGCCGIGPGAIRCV
eukprot:CAMPEP_0206428558 /NCGR_PEP_ID=MMETSP0324_2-20121206/5742_1 /ASSEMBLY_ACC=CAM_ASM_000836 /TAXON_ID=2866 /ORGANISM="Crypthecodinium cohnii, Strain Seligo" /LENGTH=319 /DNA_ID=CAMNT_0053894121 /DNA_START=127 /DNA_END=1083 /DNA_ORIENTATION=+